MKKRETLNQCFQSEITNKQVFLFFWKINEINPHFVLPLSLWPLHIHESSIPWTKYVWQQGRMWYNVHQKQTHAINCCLCCLYCLCWQGWICWQVMKNLLLMKGGWTLHHILSCCQTCFIHQIRAFSKKYLFICSLTWKQFNVSLFSKEEKLNQQKIQLFCRTGFVVLV